MFGNDTNTAIKLFQKKNYLSVDGVIGAKTWQTIRNRISQTYR
jgi:peptidoglycan hydrolase-like protein with peptidoglycan-binding domain